MAAAQLPLLLLLFHSGRPLPPLLHALRSGGGRPLPLPCRLLRWGAVAVVVVHPEIVVHSAPAIVVAARAPGGVRGAHLVGTVGFVVSVSGGNHE